MKLDEREAECLTFFDCDMNREVQTIKLSEHWTNVSRAISITKQAARDRKCSGTNHYGDIISLGMVRGSLPIMGTLFRQIRHMRTAMDHT